VLAVIVDDRRAKAGRVTLTATHATLGEAIAG
jgi:hypothetical protein